MGGIEAGESYPQMGKGAGELTCNVVRPPPLGRLLAALLPQPPAFGKGAPTAGGLVRKKNTASARCFHCGASTLAPLRLVVQLAAVGAKGEQLGVPKSGEHDTILQSATDGRQANSDVPGCNHAVPVPDQNMRHPTQGTSHLLLKLAEQSYSLVLKEAQHMRLARFKELCDTALLGNPVLNILHGMANLQRLALTMYDKQGAATRLSCPF